MTTLLTRRQQQSKGLKLKLEGLKKHRFDPYQRPSRTCTDVQVSMDKPLRHSSMSSSEPEWDTDEGDMLFICEDVPSPAVYIDILTSNSPMHLDSELFSAEQDLFKFVAIPSPAAYVDILTTSSPQQQQQQQHTIAPRSAAPSPTVPMIKVITSSSPESSDEDDDQVLVSERCIAKQDMLDGGQYIVMSFMEDGSYGMVAKAINTRTCDMVAIKINKKCKNYDEVVEHEMAMLRKLSVLDPDACGIVRFHDSFIHKGFTCMVFESLDVDLVEFMNGRDSRLSIAETRPIIQQLAVALQALKVIGLIHADIKLENIMLVNQREQPLRVKLIDFGLAVPVSESNRRRIRPIMEFRAPEVFLGLPLSEALDMWSLGCVVANMMLDDEFITGETEYDALQCIFSMLGMPAQSLLDAGLKTSSYFVKDNNMWRFMKPEEYYVKVEAEDEDEDDESSLEEVFDSLRDDEEDEASFDVFMDLLKGMLHLDPEERITPEQVLTHPFINTKPSPTPR